MFEAKNAFRRETKLNIVSFGRLFSFLGDMKQVPGGMPKSEASPSKLPALLDCQVAAINKGRRLLSLCS